MIPYFLFLGYVIIFLTFSKLVKSDLFFYLSFLTLVLFSGLRFDVGVDFLSYVEVFSDFKNDNFLFLFEPANMFIINTINVLNVDYQLIFLIYSMIIMFGVFYFIKKLSPSKELSILLFVTIGIFYFSTFNGIRQWAAISIILIAIVKLIESRYIQFFLCIILATLFHISAMITLVLVFFKFRINKFYLLIIFFTLILSSKIFLYLIYNTKYVIYIDSLRFEQTGNSLLLWIYVFTLISIPLLFGYFRKSVLLNTQEIVLLNMNIMSILILILGYQLNIDFLSLMRVNMYFQIQLIILVPMLALRIKNKQLNYIYVYIIVVFSFIYLFNTIYNNGIVNNLVPYKTVFDYKGN